MELQETCLSVDADLQRFEAAGNPIRVAMAGAGATGRAIAAAAANLRRCVLLRENGKIPEVKAMFLKYANIIFDLERAEALKAGHGCLDDIGIAYCGRYGDWGYM